MYNQLKKYDTVAAVQDNLFLNLNSSTVCNAIYNKNKNVWLTAAWRDDTK